MTAVVVHAVADLRRRWRAWLAVTLLVGLVGGPAVALAAGARRTDSSYSRFLRAERAADAEVFLPAGSTLRIDELPEVAESASETALASPDQTIFPLVPDAGYGTRINRFKLLSGRRAEAERPDEVVVAFLYARQRHLRVGSPLAIPITVDPRAAVVLRLRVVGIEASPTEFPPQSSSSAPGVYLTRSVLGDARIAKAARSGNGGTVVAVRLRRGQADIQRFESEINRSAGSYTYIERPAIQAGNVERSIHLQAVALWVMAGVAALVGAVVLLQLLTRQVGFDAVESEVLRALGMSPAQRLGSVLVRSLVAGVGGAIAALAVATALSPLFPTGTARIAEPSPGVATDPLALAIGFAAITLGVVVLGVAAASRVATRAERSIAGDRPQSPSLVGRAAAALRLPLAVSTGARMALQPGRGNTSVPVRTTLVAAALGVGALTAAVTFGSSLGHLLDTPALYGTTYDAHVTTNGNFEPIAPAIPALRDDPDVVAAATASTGVPLRSGSVDFGAQETTAVKGALSAIIVAGRAPTSTDEIALGSRTMRQLHTAIGRSIPVQVEGVTGPRPMRVVGRGVLAPISDNEQMGRGAIVASGGLDAFKSLAPPGFKVPPESEALVSFRRGIDKTRALAAAQARMGPVFDVSFTPPDKPTDVVNYDQIRYMPDILAALLSVIAVAATAYLLIAAIGRRRRELAILKTLGFVPRQVAWAVGWQATIVAVVALSVGLPLGIAAGRSIWMVLVNQIGAVDQPVVPWALVLVIIPAALVVANVVAAGPAAAAARIRPAPVLRSE